MHHEDWEFNLWDLERAPASVRSWLALVHDHDPAALEVWPSDWSRWCTKVSPVHVFAAAPVPTGRRCDSARLLDELRARTATLAAPDAHGWAPLTYAAWFGRAATLDLLLEQGAPTTNAHGLQPLAAALSQLSASIRPDRERANARLGPKATASAAQPLPGLDWPSRSERGLARLVRQRFRGGGGAAPNGPHATCARLLLMAGAPIQATVPGLSDSITNGAVSWLAWALNNEQFDWADLLWTFGARLSDRDVHAVILSGEGPALVWCQLRGIPIADQLSTHHNDRLAVAQAKAVRDHALLDEVRRPLASEADRWHAVLDRLEIVLRSGGTGGSVGADGDEDGGGRGRRRM